MDGVEKDREYMTWYFPVPVSQADAGNPAQFKNGALWQPLNFCG